jgi:hypothetical protein
VDLKVFSVLLSYIQQKSESAKRFKLILKKFLNENSIHSLEEYFQVHNT